MRPVIVTERLELHTLCLEDLAMLLDGVGQLHGFTIPRGWPHDVPGEAAMVQFFLDRLIAVPELAEWRIRMMIERSLSEMVGHIGFHDPPADGRLELGYTVFEPHRRCGLASEAIVAMMDAAHSEHGIDRFRLAISPTNEPSLCLADRLGFERVGEQVDVDDGLEWVYERTWPASGAN